ncbi:MAG: SDR family NAD(P)-dependent oxidoreductase, partial [Saprospiraceae bacterium]
MSQFEKKIALIIGGTSGIGHATATALLEEGATVHIVGRSTGKIADAPQLVKHQIDITKQAEVDRLIDQLGGLDNLDYLVNASGIFGPKPFLDHTLADYNSYLDLNRGFFFLTQAVAKNMKDTGS